MSLDLNMCRERHPFNRFRQRFSRDKIAIYHRVPTQSILCGIYYVVESDISGEMMFNGALTICIYLPTDIEVVVVDFLFLFFAPAI